MNEKLINYSYYILHWPNIARFFFTLYLLKTSAKVTVYIMSFIIGPDHGHMVRITNYIRTKPGGGRKAYISKAWQKNF